MTLFVKTLEDLSDATSTLLSFAANRKKMAFTGEIGAGKTTFIQRICQQLGVKEAVTSPTFSLINEYLVENSKENPFPVYHLDLYRLKNEQEAIDIGIEDYLYDEHYCFVEWPERAGNYLPVADLNIDLLVLSGSNITARQLHCVANSEAGARLLRAWAI